MIATDMSVHRRELDEGFVHVDGVGERLVAADARYGGKFLRVCYVSYLGGQEVRFFSIYEKSYIEQTSRLLLPVNKCSSLLSDTPQTHVCNCDAPPR
jgi:hypothetical protein